MGHDFPDWPERKGPVHRQPGRMVDKGLVQVEPLAARCPLQAIAVNCIPGMSRRPGGRGH